MGIVALGTIMDAISEARDGDPRAVLSGVAVAVVFVYFAAGKPKSSVGSYVLWTAAVLMLVSLILRLLA